MRQYSIYQTCVLGKHNTFKYCTEDCNYNQNHTCVYRPMIPVIPLDRAKWIHTYFNELERHNLQ